MQAKGRPLVGNVRYIRSARACGPHPEFFPIKDGAPVPWDDAHAAVETYRSCFGYEHTIDSLAREGGLTVREYHMLSQRKNPVTGDDMTFVKPEASTHVRCRAVLLRFTGKPDANGDVIDPSGITIPEKILVTRGFKKGTANVLGIGDVKVEGIELVCYFTLSTGELPQFPLYAAIGGVIHEASFTDSDVRVIKRCRIQEVAISTTPNQDPTIPPISAVYSEATSSAPKTRDV